MLALRFLIMTTLTVDRYLNHNGAQVPQIGYVGTYCRPMVTSNSATTNREKGLSAQVILHHKHIARYNFVFFMGNPFSHTQTQGCMDALV